MLLFFFHNVSEGAPQVRHVNLDAPRSATTASHLSGNLRHSSRTPEYVELPYSPDHQPSRLYLLETQGADRYIFD